MRASGRTLIGVAVLVVLVLGLVVPPAYAQGGVHVIQRGETLWSIATRYGTTVDALVRTNGLANSRLIYAGQRLTIPSGSTGAVGGGAGAAAGATYTVQRGDSVTAIARRYGTTVAAIASANRLANPSYIYVGQRLVIPGGSGGNVPVNPGASSGSGSVHVVQRGDTVASIAYRYGTTIAAIASANGLTNPGLIYAGQRLKIPSGSTPAPAPASGATSGGGKRILVDLSAQRMYVYQNGQLLWNWVVSTGRPGQATAVGSYSVLNKLPNAYASTWALQMPYWLGIYWAGRLQNGIHALPIQSNGQRLWEGYLGQPVSYGCVILSTQNAITLYNWAPVGTPVDIVW